MKGRAALGAAAAGLLLSACAAGPDYAAPDLPVPERFAGDPQSGAPAPADTGTPWWDGFSDPVLSDLVETALADNLSVAQAAQRLAAAEALAGAARSDFFPTLDGDITGVARSDGTDAAEAGLAATQIIDINGRLRRAEDRARAQALAARYDLADTRRLTAASVASLYVELRRTRARLALLDASLDLQQRTLDIVERRAEAGLSADLDVRRAAADLARTRAQRGGLALQRARALNGLSVLLAQAPGDALGAFDLELETEGDAAAALGLSYDGAIRAGVPADLLRRRPDLRAAEADLVAATAAIGVEAADLYPSLRIPGSLSADLTDGAGEDVIAAISAVIDVPIFDLGRRRAEVRAAEARAAEAALAYEQALLDALREVETGFVAIESVRATLADLDTAVAESEQAFSQLNALYREGLASFIDVLDAQRTLIDSREAFVDSEADLASAVIDLQLALAAPAGARTPSTPSTD
jgi:NodT family efflux transporter outer membrane factor (OMF) lipoprotein